MLISITPIAELKDSLVGFGDLIADTEAKKSQKCQKIVIPT